MTTARRRRTTSSADAESSSGALTGYEAELWRMADALRGSMDAAEYKHVVLRPHLPQVHLRRLPRDARLVGVEDGRGVRSGGHG